MSGLLLPDADVRALATGETIVAFASRVAVEAGDEVALASSGPRPAAELKPAYRHWAAMGPPEGDWLAVVEGVHPAALLGDDSGSARHVLTDVPHGDVVVLRVYGPDGPVLSDAAFAARLRSLGHSL